MYFYDEAGQFQFTGGGLFVLVLLSVIIALTIVDIVKNFFFYRSGYYALKKEMDDLREEVEKNLPIHLEHYYQSRKKWEKKNFFW